MTLSHLECSRTGRAHGTDALRNLSEAGAPLLARYDLAGLDRERVRSRPFDLWRYREVLPLPENQEPVSLGEGGTPLLPAPRIARALGLTRLLVKDESRNPTGSFKDRGLACAVSMAKCLGATALALPSAGNAGASVAAYGARAGLEVHVFVPSDAPRANVEEAQAYGASVTRVDGLIDACGRSVTESCERFGWYDVATLKEPYRLEGKKTMAYELVEQLGGEPPDVILYPTGGGTGLIGMWKGFDEMEALGWIGEKRPRIVSVQAKGCAPVLRALETGAAECTLWPNAATVAPGLRVPKALGDFLILKAIRETRGTAVAVSDDALLAGARRLAREEGILACPEGGACLAALEALVEKAWIDPDETVVLFNTASGLKYL